MKTSAKFSLGFALAIPCGLFYLFIILFQSSGTLDEYLAGHVQRKSHYGLVALGFYLGALGISFATAWKSARPWVPLVSFCSARLGSFFYDYRYVSSAELVELWVAPFTILIFTLSIGLIFSALNDDLQP